MPIVTNGKRKQAVAKVTLREGDGKITINKRPHVYFQMFRRLLIEEPIRIAKENGIDMDYNFDIVVRGGGQDSQIEAARLAIARALVEAARLKSSKAGEDLKRAFLIYDRNMLIADTRRREAYKPGDSKARSKRQKSYR